MALTLKTRTPRGWPPSPSPLTIPRAGSSVCTPPRSRATRSFLGRGRSPGRCSSSGLRRVTCAATGSGRWWSARVWATTRSTSPASASRRSPSTSPRPRSGRRSGASRTRPSSTWPPTCSIRRPSGARPSTWWWRASRSRPFPILLAHRPSPTLRISSLRAGRCSSRPARASRGTSRTDRRGRSPAPRSTRSRAAACAP